MQPLISVILPVYNGAAFLQQSINSVLQQSLQSFEFIICDDASTDDSYAVLQQYHDVRIVLLRHDTNKGLFATLNELCNKANSNLIKLWAQDDVMINNCLAETVAFHQQYPDISFSYTDRLVINEHNEIIGGNTLENDATPEYIANQLHDKIAFYTGSIAGNIANVTIRKDLWLAVGGFNEQMTISADFDMWVKLSAQHNIGRIRKPLVQLRDHGGQLSRQSKYYLLHMQEDMQVYDVVMKRSNKDMIAFGKYYLNWRKAPLYFSFMFLQLRQGKIQDALVFLKAMGTHFSIPATFMRWCMIKFLGKKIKQPSLWQ